MQEIQINGKTLVCLFCGNKTFDEVKTLQNRRSLAFLDLEVFNVMFKKAFGIAYICNQCGLMHEFFRERPKKDSKKGLVELFS